jgi:hypothetical protein
MPAKHQFCAHCKLETDILEAIIETQPSSSSMFWVFCSLGCQILHEKQRLLVAELGSNP